MVSWDASHWLRAWRIWSFTSFRPNLALQHAAEARCEGGVVTIFWNPKTWLHELNIKYATLLMISLSRIYILNTYPLIKVGRMPYSLVIHTISSSLYIIVKLMSLGYVWNIGLDIMGYIMGISYWLDTYKAHMEVWNPSGYPQSSSKSETTTTSYWNNYGDDWGSPSL